MIPEASRNGSLRSGAATHANISKATAQVCANRTQLKSLQCKHATGWPCAQSDALRR